MSPETQPPRPAAPADEHAKATEEEIAAARVRLERGDGTRHRVADPEAEDSADPSKD
jgi:hypothetical protein